MAKFIDLTGKRFNRWFVIKYDLNKDKPYWLCKCDCGIIKSIRGSHLTGGTSQSCGCLMRCLKPKCKYYSQYGGRGIAIHSEWINDFQAFYAHVGPRPTKQHSVDRINNNGNYEPGNVRWATKKEQADNRRKPKLLAHCTNVELLAELTRRHLAKFIPIVI